MAEEKKAEPEEGAPSPEAVKAADEIGKELAEAFKPARSSPRA